MENVQVLGLNVGEAQLESPESLSSVSGGPIPFKCAWGSKRGLEAGPFGVCLEDQNVELRARLAGCIGLRHC